MKRSNDPSRRYIINFNREGIFAAAVAITHRLEGISKKKTWFSFWDVNERYKPCLSNANAYSKPWTRLMATASAVCF